MLVVLPDQRIGDLIIIILRLYRVNRDMTSGLSQKAIQLTASVKPVKVVKFVFSLIIKGSVSKVLLRYGNSQTLL